MAEKQQKKFLTVAPFECAWPNDLRFREAGRGCVAFEAFAHNDVTVVFRENVGSQHYHYKRDNSPHYTVILGSHRNRRLKIEVSGKTVVDAAGVGLCCSSAFQSYWISIYDGLISIGKGRYPFQNLVFQWLDSNPNCSVQYVGLSSWDKHVGYRNVNVLPLTQNYISLWKHVGSGEYEGKQDGEEEMVYESEPYENWGLLNFLEKWELSDMIFIVGKEKRTVPAHKIILAASGNFNFSLFDHDVIHLHDVSYPVLHAFLQYIYTGHTQISESQLNPLRNLSLKYEVTSLVKQCEEISERFKLNKKLFDSGKNVEILYPSSKPHCGTAFPSGLPLNMQRLEQFYTTGKYSDVGIYIDGHGFLFRSHKIILALWSVPFFKMFTNGMSESISSKILLQDVPLEAFKLMLEFLYRGELNNNDTMDIGTLLLQLLLLADQFGVTLLHQECCKTLLECLSEDTVYPILQVIPSIPSCKLVQETCERKFATHFDYCTTASTDFVSLDEETFCRILKHPDLTVTSEERVLNAILLWCLQAKDLYGWDTLDEMMADLEPELLFGERFQSVSNFLPLVRFPLLPHPLLKKLEKSNLSRKFHTFDFLVKEAIHYSEFGLAEPQADKNVRFRHRRSSFKELQYICDGGTNGVLYFAGTSFGEHQWVNPVLARKICITPSSPISRYTDPKVLVSRAYQGTSFAGPRIEDGKNSAWWMIDLGEDHQLMCNYYTVRQDGSRTYIRHWNLQGSADGKTWTVLRVHENDQTICKPGQFASWPIAGPSALLPFRFFRVILTAPTTDESNPWSFCICFLELYGYFR
ncbi:BTB/POZ domain-containing protein At2g30600 [Diospyros lotus]|uniref:BTB/POZ domain-containing protein At2g30600 n=1 Tax=Diospyros lotus TaxID=55363 RepID=UPI00225032E8|nr:BTB/POZ domain-containing protein At2g30600 [Diospyros lotus]XP_052202276.1 BTB/POZ domain-containing protein At2g30600 [Diospyros lotus]